AGRRKTPHSASHPEARSRSPPLRLSRQALAFSGSAKESAINSVPPFSSLRTLCTPCPLCKILSFLCFYPTTSPPPPPAARLPAKYSRRLQEARPSHQTPPDSSANTPACRPPPVRLP